MPTIETFETKQPPLSEILSAIAAGDIQLPDFQRDWVWDDLHIRELIASVSLSYPIGAIMLLETGGDGARFKPRPVEGAEPDDVEPELLILDGQQRLTSLFLALKSGKPVPTKTEKGKDIERIYYLDMEKTLAPDEDRVDSVLSIPPERQVRSDFGRKVDLDVSTPALEYEQFFFPLDRVYNPARFLEWMGGCRSQHGHAPETSVFLDRFQELVWLVFTQYKLPVIEIKRATAKEAVCQVFEKVNTGGVALTVFELMTATYAADGFELRKDWKARKDGGQPGADEFERVPAELGALSEFPVLGTFDESDFLTAVTLLSSYERSLSSDRPVSCKRKDVLKLDLETYRSNANRIHRALIDSSRFLARQKVFDAKNLPYKTQLVPLAAMCAALRNQFEHETVRDKLARWYWCGVFGEMYGGANETRFALDVPQVIQWIRGGQEPKEPRTVLDSSFSPTRLLTLQSRQSAAYKGLAALLMQQGSCDFLSGDPVELNSFFDRAIDIHHIFPRAYCESAGLPSQKWNSVINKTPLSSYSNRKLGGRAPSSYLRSIEEEEDLRLNRRRLDEILDSHAIDGRILRSDSFERFIQDRASRLLDLIHAATGRPVQGRDSEEVVEQFGADLTRTEGSETPGPDSEPPIEPLTT